MTSSCDASPRRVRSCGRSGAGAISILAVCLIASVAHAQPIALERLTVPSDGHPMAVWARRPAAPRGAVLLVHGRTWSSRPDFDLQVPGLQRSVLVSLSQAGIAAYAVDLRGYGETRRDASGWGTPRRSAADLTNVAAWIAQQHPTLPRPAVIGWSLGAAISMLAAQTAPHRFSALVVYGFSFDPAAAAASDFVSPRVTPQAVIDAFVAQALRADPITVDLRNEGELNAVEPSRIAVPTLVLFGERDASVPVAEAAKMFASFGTADRQLVELPGGDHAAHLEDTHDAWTAAVISFLSRPPVRRR